MRRLGLLLALGGLWAVAASAQGTPASSQHFDHWRHRKVFPTCLSCHPGAADPSRSFWPKPEQCESCHDGTVEKKVDWDGTPPARVSNLRFTHDIHVEKFRKKFGADSTQACMSCHSRAGAAWMEVTRTVPERCLDCHGIQVAHHAAPDSACATCHLKLADSKLTEARIATFPKPPSHDSAGFYPGRHHGELAQSAKGAEGKPYAVAPSCATCHARDFCLQCHVDAPEVKAIQALDPDPRSLAIEAKLEAPASHQDPRWQARHGGESRRDKAACSTCHTQQSCLACHRASPAVAVAMYPAGPGRGVGARIQRKPPSTHVGKWADEHARVARSTPNSCSGCHARSECLECHRPNAASADGYHAAGWLARHPAAAYSRQTDCAECHNTAQFCTSCHQSSGLTSVGNLLSGQYHDAQPSFRLGHGQAARQSLESCVSCHAERDCLTCHSAQSGRHFDPHGPGFDAERLKKKNPQMCSACHGSNIP